MAWPFWLARFGPALGKILWERSKKLLGSALTKWEYKRIALQIGRQAKKNKWSAKRIQEEVEKYYKEIKQGKDWHTNVKDLKPDDYVELFWEDPLGLEEGRQVEEGPTEPDGVILYGSWSKEDLLDWVSDWKDLKVKGDIVEGYVDGEFVRARIRKNPEEGASQIDELQRVDAFDPADHSAHELMGDDLLDDFDPKKLMNMEGKDMSPMQLQAWKKHLKDQREKFTEAEDEEEAKRLEDIRNKPKGKDILRADIVDDFKDLDDYLRAETDDPVLREFKNELLRSRMERRNDENLARMRLQQASKKFRGEAQEGKDPRTDSMNYSDKEINDFTRDILASPFQKGSAPGWSKKDALQSSLFSNKALMNTPVAATALAGTTASLVHKNKSKKGK